MDNIVHNIPESVAFDPALANEVGKIHEKPYFDVEKLQASLNGEEPTETSTAEAETEEAADAEATEATEVTEAGEGETTEETSEVTETADTEAPAEPTVSFH